MPILWSCHYVGAYIHILTETNTVATKLVFTCCGATHEEFITVDGTGAANPGHSANTSHNHHKMHGTMLHTTDI